VYDGAVFRKVGPVAVEHGFDFAPRPHLYAGGQRNTRVSCVILFLVKKQAGGLGCQMFVVVGDRRRTTL